MELSDEEIVKKVINGDLESFGVLMERYEKKLLRYACKFLVFEEKATDLVQDIFIKVYVNLKKFDTSMRFSPWIYRIAHNEFVNELKRRTKEPLLTLDSDTFFPHLKAEETADKETQYQELKVELEHSLSQIEPKYREPLVLYFFEDMSYQDISIVLKIPISTVGVRISRAKAKLKKVASNILDI